MNRLIYTLFFITALIGCTSTKTIEIDQFIGRYEWIGTYGVVAKMRFKEDKTFEYDWQTGLNSGITTGTWKIDGNKVILNSRRQPSQADSYKLLNKSNLGKDSIVIAVFNEKGEPMPHADSILKLNSIVIAKASTDTLGIAKLPKMKADSIVINYVGYKPIQYLIEDLNTDFYQFELDIEDEPYVYFNSEKWIIKKGRIKDPSPKGARIFTKRSTGKN